MKFCKAETIHNFSQRSYKLAWKAVASFSPLTSQEYQYILDLSIIGNIRVRLISLLD